MKRNVQQIPKHKAPKCLLDELHRCGPLGVLGKHHEGLQRVHAESQDNRLGLSEVPVLLQQVHSGWKEKRRGFSVWSMGFKVYYAPKWSRHWTVKSGFVYMKNFITLNQPDSSFTSCDPDAAPAIGMLCIFFWCLSMLCLLEKYFSHNSPARKWKHFDGFKDLSFCVTHTDGSVKSSCLRCLLSPPAPSWPWRSSPRQSSQTSSSCCHFPLCDLNLLVTLSPCRDCWPQRR